MYVGVPSNARACLRRRGVELCDAEVEQLDRGAREHHHVVGLEIAVDDAVLVRRLQRVGDLARDADDAARRQRAALEHAV
jgi:hypothetical protein